MSGKVVLSTGPADPVFGAGQHPSETEVKPVKSAKAADATHPADIRLIIEEAGKPGQYVYTVLDRRTGKIISQLPREEVLRMREEAGYAAGAVFDGRA